jgi:fructokinase
VLVEQRGGTHLFVILPDQAWDHVEAAPLLAALDTSAAQLLYFGTLAQRAPATRAALASLLAATSAPRFLDLNLRAGQVTPACVLASLHEADVAKVNEDELCWLHKALGHAGAPPADLSTPAAAAACAGLVRLFGLRALVVTAGERGAWYVGADGTYLHAAAGPVARFADTVGAGDAFAAVFMLGSVRGWPPALTLERAVDFASAICAVPGAVPADPQFYAPWRARWLAGFH